MAATELYNSREMHITEEGTTLTQVFAANRTDFNAWSGLPVIGTRWSPGRRDLRVTDIETTWLNNDDCRVRCFYSTKNKGHIDEQYGGTIRFEAASSRQVNDIYYHFTDEDWVSWTEKWTDEGGDADKVPDLPIRKPHLCARISLYVSWWSFEIVTHALGMVNSSDFLRQLQTQLRLASTGELEEVRVDITGDDTGRWLFDDFGAERIREGLWRLDMDFLFNYESTWNYGRYGFDTGRYGSYEFRDLVGLMEPYRGIDDGLR